MSGLVRRYLGLLGIVSIVLAWVHVIVVTAVSGRLNIVSTALSDLGGWISACDGYPVRISMCNRLSEPISNYGLIVSGLLLASASAGLYGLSRSYQFLITVSGISLAFSGFLPERFSAYHFLLALAFFSTLPTAMIVYSMINWREGLFPKTTLISAIPSFTSLILFVAIKLKIVIGLGFAIPEIIGVLPTSIWAGLVFYRYAVKQ